MTRMNAECLVCVETAEQRGSGYLLAPNLVLTAGHCVESAGTQVEVKRFERHADGLYGLTHPRTFRVEVNGENGSPGGQKIDFALLTSTDDDPFAIGERTSSDDVRLGRLVGMAAVPAQALGFPRAQVGSSRMNVEDARGTIRPLAGARSAGDSGVLIERLNFQVETGAPTSRPGASLWSGMSGSALFSGDHLVGVIVEDRAAMNGRLHAVPASRIFGDQGRPDANRCLNGALGLEPATPVRPDPVWAGGDVLRPPYEPMPIRHQWSEADLLRARHDVVPFRGRKEQLRELIEWCEGNTERPVYARLLSGDGAVGKTRLARELCRRMSDKGWIAGIIDPVDLLRVGFSQLLDLPERRLVVVDDADAYTGQLKTLLDEAMKDRSGYPLRILAIAHRDDQWWQALRRRYEALLEERDPPLLTAPEYEERKFVYDAALESFTSWYEQKEAKQKTGTDQEQANRQEDGPNLEEPAFASYLLVLIQALVDARARIGIEESTAVVGGPRPISLRAALLDYALDVEREAWRKTAGQAGLYDDPVLLERVVAISCLAVTDRPVEGAGESEAARRLRLVPDLADEPEWRRRAFARWQYTQFSGEGYLRTLQPLRLANRLESKVIAAFPELATQLLDVGSTCDGTPRTPAAQARQVLNVLQLLQFTMADDDRPADRPDDTHPSEKPDTEQCKARQALTAALHQHAAALVRLVKCVARADQDDSARPIGTSLAAALDSTLRRESAQEVAAQVLREFDVICPDAMLELATAVAEHAVQYHRRASGPPTEENRRELARALQRWSLYLACSGLRIRAHEVAGQAVDTYHALQQLSPSEDHDFYLAEALKELADRLVDIGRFEDADHCARDAVRRLEALFQQNRTRRHAFGLVKALCTLATAAHSIGRQREALQAATEACELIEQLPQARQGDAEYEPDEIQGMKAFALRVHAWQLGASGHVDQAVAKATESVETYEALRERHPGLWKRDVAEALSVLGVQHAAREEWQECVAQLSKAVDGHYNALEREYREAVRPQHALALGRLAEAYLGRARSRPAEMRHEDLEKALEYVKQALDQYEKMHKEDSWANRVHEARTSCLQAEILLELGTTDRRSGVTAAGRQSYERAEAAARRALSLYDELDVRAWKLRFDRACAQAVLAKAYGGRGRPRSKVLRAHEQAKQAFVRLETEEPGRAEDEVQKIESTIESLRQAGPPVQARAKASANRSGKRRKRHQPNPRLRSRQSTHARRRHR